MCACIMQSRGKISNHCREAIEGDDIRHREGWTSVGRIWCSNTSGKKKKKQPQKKRNLPKKSKKIGV